LNGRGRVTPARPANEEAPDSEECDFKSFFRIDSEKGISYFGGAFCAGFRSVPV
jgi:hypothetical protein